MTYQLTANTGETATAATIKAIADQARQILIDHFTQSTTRITITTPEGWTYPFAQGAGRVDLPPEAVAAAVDELIYGIRAALHWQHDEQTP